MHVCVYACMCACFNVCMHVYMYECIHASKKSGHLKSMVRILSVVVLSTFVITSCGFVCWGFVLALK